MRATLCDRPEVMPMAPDEAAQIALAQQDPHAFAPIYLRYADDVYRYCYRRLGDRDAAADATSLVFSRALAALPRYHDTSFRSWLFTIAHNAVIDGWRSARPAAPLEAGLKRPDPALSPEETVLRDDAGREVRAMLTSLPKDQRHVVELRLAGLTNQEIADTLGRSVAATKMLQVRAMARLRTLITDERGIAGNGNGR
jgi:RNA polymerase sigma-70 factor, ECF subfamily